MRATARDASCRHCAGMKRRRPPEADPQVVTRVAIVAREPGMRMAAASAFDAAPSDWLVDLYTAPPAEWDVLLVCPDVTEAIQGGIRFDPANPAEVLAEIPGRASTRGTPTVAVTGACRGCGVTSLALHLSAAFVPLTDVCYIDLDRRWGAAQRLGLEPFATKTWDAFDGSPESLRACALPVRGGFRALFSPFGKEDAERPDEGQLLSRADALFGAVVADVPSPCAFERAAPHCEVFVLVLPPTRPAAGRARRLIDSWPQLNWLLVSNRCGPGGETTRAELQAIIGRRVALELPCAPSLRDAEDDGRLLTSRLSPWVRRVDRLARTLASL